MYYQNNQYYSSPMLKQRKFDSIKQLLEKQTSRNECLVEENEKYAKTQESLIRLLEIRDREIREAGSIRHKGRQYGHKAVVHVIRKYTYYNILKHKFDQWKVILYQKRDSE